MHDLNNQPIDNPAPIVVPETMDSDTANRLYGESYGVDWVYEDGLQTRLT